MTEDYEQQTFKID